MRKEHTLLLTMGSALLISSSAAFAAGPPINYGQYQADSSGNITLGTRVSTGPTTGTLSTGVGNDCPVPGGTCGVPITGNGFMQRQITTSSGDIYFQTIILEKNTQIDPGTDGYANLSSKPFADESFVKQHSSVGIADSSHVFASPTTSDTSSFTGDTTINTGWAYQSGTNNRIEVTQTIDDPTIGRRSNMTFNLTDASSDNTEPVITLDQTVYLPKDTATTSTTNDRQRFYLKQLKASGGGTTVALPDSTPTKPTTLSYSSGDILQVMWVGQTVGGGTSTGGAQTFGAQAYTTNPNATGTTTTASVNYANQASTGPWNWDSAFFGAAPTF